MKKAVNLVALIVMVSTNIITPFSYADVENVAIVDIEQPVVEQPKAPEIPEPETPATPEIKEPEVPEVSEPEAPVEQPKAEPETGTGVDGKVETPAIETPETGTGVDGKGEIPVEQPKTEPETGTGVDGKVEIPVEQPKTEPETGTGVEEKVEILKDKNESEVESGKNLDLALDLLQQEIDKEKQKELMAVLVDRVSYGETVFNATIEGNSGTMNDFEYKEIVVTDGSEKYTLMDRNLGATDRWNTNDNGWSSYNSNIYNNTNTPGSYGYYYQYGNNFGFEAGITPTISSTPVAVSQWTGKTSTYSSSTWISTTPWNSGATVNDTLWGGNGGTQVQRRGPCPEGWHVPSIDEWNGVLDILNVGDWSEVQTFANAIYLPPAGYHYFNTFSSYSYVGSRGFYWASSIGADNFAHGLTFSGGWRGNWSLGDVWRSYGMSIRCFKNTVDEISGDIPVNITFNANGGYFSGGSSEKIATYTKDEAFNYVTDTIIDFPNKEAEGDTKYMFDWWYLTGMEERWTGYISEDMTLYANYLPFEDLVFNFSGVEVVIMDRNLGATESGTGCSSDTTTGACGYQYQWGNNYGFAHDGVNNSTGFLHNENISKRQASDWDGKASSYYSNIFRTVSPWNRGATTGDNLWGGAVLWNTDEDRQGPCPAGYHVPDIKEWSGLYYKMNRPGRDKLSNDLLLPPGGWRDASSQKVQSLGSMIGYRSSTPASTTSRAKAILMQPGYGNNMSHDGGRSDPLSVRCFKNNTGTRVIKFESNGGSYVPDSRTGRWWEYEEELPTPTMPNKNFEGWYTTPTFDKGTHVLTRMISGDDTDEPIILYAKYLDLDKAVAISGQNESRNTFVYDTIVVGDYTVMDRDLGAPGINGLGYWYQWGNNYGFENGNKRQSYLDLIINDDEIPSKHFTGVWYALGSSTKFSSWTDDKERNLWGGTTNTDAARRGPCPSGWHVPSANDWDGLYTAWQNRDNKSTGGVGTYGNFIYDFNLDYIGKGKRSMYWDYMSDTDKAIYRSSDRGNSSYAATCFKISTSSKSIDRSSVMPTYGVHVRCFKDRYTLNFDSVGGSSISSVRSSTQRSRPTNPTRKGSNFIDWYTSTGYDTIFDFSTPVTEDKTIYAKWECQEGYEMNEDGLCVEIITLTLNPDGGVWEDGDEEKYLRYKKLTKGQRYSHTDNISDEGTRSGDYRNDESKIDVITMTGASSLHVNLTYGTENNWDMVYVFEGIYSGSVSRNMEVGQKYKFMGGNNTLTETGFDIEGDTVTFAFFSDNSNRYYGYYAIIKSESIEPDESNEEITNPTNGDYKFLGRYEEGVSEYYDFSEIPNNNKIIYARRSNNGGEINSGATLKKGLDFNLAIKSLAKGSEVTDYSNSDNLIKQIKKADFIPNGVYNTGLISAPESEVPIYAWYNNGILYYYTQANKVYMNKNSSYMFYNLKGLTETDLSNWNTTKANNMSYMFHGCSSLKTIKFGPNWDTSNVTSMSSMFYGCSSLTGLGIGDWDTSNVTSMNSMFNSCSKLESLDISGWDTSNVTSMSSMFYGCSSLTGLDMADWDTSSVNDMSYMFYGCSSLTGLDIGDWDTSNVITMYYMFYNCNKLESLDIGNWDTSSVNDMSYMFYGCSSLTGLDISDWNTSNVTTMNSMFYNCNKLESLDISGWDTSSVTTTSYMFYGCSSLTGLDIGDWDTSNVITMYSMFYNCNKLESLDISGWDTSSVNDMSYMFYGCSSLTGLDIGDWDTSNVKMMNYMFYNCNSLTNLNVSNWDTSSVANMALLFYNCSSLTSLDLTNWDTSSVTNMGSMFQYCSGLTVLDLSKFNTSSVTDMSNMFQNCSNLTTIYASPKFRVSNVTSSYQIFGGLDNILGGSGTTYDLNKSNSVEYARIDNAPEKPGYFTQSGITIGTTAYLLNGPDFNRKIKSLAISGNVSSYLTPDTLITGFQRVDIIPDGVITGVISASDSEVPVYAWFTGGIIYYNTTADEIELNGNSSYMFANIKGLTGIDLNFNKNSVTNMNNMFAGCTGLIEINLNNLEHVQNMQYMFAGCTSLRNVNINNTKNIEDMGYMFVGCSNLTNIDLSNLNTKKLRYSNYMFQGCTNLESVNLSNWDLSNIYNGNYMFEGCTKLTDLKLDGWKFSKASGIYSLLGDCPINKVSLKGWKIPKNFSYGLNNLFNSAESSLEEIDVSNWDLSEAENISNLFLSLKVKRIIGIKTRTGTNVKLKNMSYMFQNAYNLEEIDMSDMDFSKVTTIYEMFQGSSFSNPSQLKKINMSNIKFDSLENMGYFCQNCYNLEEVDLSNWNVDMPNLLSYETNGLFQNAYKLIKVNLRNFGKVSSTYAMFQNNYSLIDLDLSGLDTSKATDMSYMFFGMSGINKLNLSDLDTSNVKNMSYMFYNTSNLKTIFVSDKFNTDNVTKHDDMFSGAISLVGGKGTFYDKNHIDKEYARIDTQSTPGYFTLNGEDSVDPVDPVVPDDGKDSSSNSSSGSGGKRFTPASTDSISDKIKEKEHNSANEKQDEDKSVDTQENQDSSIPSIDKDSQSDIKTSGGQKGGKDNNQNSIQYTQEQKEAYSFAKSNGITTTSTIKDAKMNSNITRIEMAKMLSYYAINVLGKTPDTSKTIKFKDVSSRKDKQYDNGVTLAYQLGIMGQNVKNNKFRPNDEVTRAELVTSLSRMLYGTPEGTNKGTSKYYEPHMAKLYNEGIITNTDPNLKEKRGYVMTMLMRSVNK